MSASQPSPGGGGNGIVANLKNRSDALKDRLKTLKTSASKKSFWCRDRDPSSSGFKALICKCARKTKSHAPPRIAKDQALAKRIGWIVATLLLLVFMIIQIMNTLRPYIDDEVTTSSLPRASLNLEYPAVTICNANLILECLYNLEPCKNESWSSKYDNCYTFNGGDLTAASARREEEGGTLWSNLQNTSATLKSMRPGPIHGLDLTLQIKPRVFTSVLSFLDKDAGIKVVIHNQTRMPFPDEEAFTVSPGQTTFVGMRLKHFYELEDQYDEIKKWRRYAGDVGCIGDSFGGSSNDSSNGTASNDNSSNGTSSGGPSIEMYSNYSVDYSRLACLKSCYQSNLIARCQCHDALLLNMTESSEPCAINNATDNGIQWSCFKEIKRLSSDGELGCFCPSSCFDMVFDNDISTNAWHAIKGDIICQKLVEKILFEMDDTQVAADVEEIANLSITNVGWYSSQHEVISDIFGKDAIDWNVPEPDKMLEDKLRTAICQDPNGMPSVARLKIYFEHFVVEEVRQHPKRTFLDIIPDLFASMLLCLGISIFAIFELIHMLGDFVVNSFKKTKIEPIKDEDEWFTDFFIYSTYIQGCDDLSFCDRGPVWEMVLDVELRSIMEEIVLITVVEMIIEEIVVEELVYIAKERAILEEIVAREILEEIITEVAIEVSEITIIEVIEILLAEAVEQAVWDIIAIEVVEEILTMGVAEEIAVRSLYFEIVDMLIGEIAYGSIYGESAYGEIADVIVKLVVDEKVQQIVEQIYVQLTIEDIVAKSVLAEMLRGTVNEMVADLAGECIQRPKVEAKLTRRESLYPYFNSAAEIEKPSETLDIEFPKDFSARINLIISAKNFIDTDIFSKSNPSCIVFMKEFGSSEFREIARTERIKNNLNPKWEKRIPVEYHFEERQEIRFDIHDIDEGVFSFDDRDFLGRIETTVGSIVSGAYHRVFEMPLTGAKRGSIIVECEEVVPRTTSDHAFLRYMMDGVQMNCCLAVDFTGSNGEPSQPDSLHYLKGDNAYIESIRSILTIMEEYDTDKMFPSYGFGAKLPKTSTVNHAFPLSLDDSKLECAGVDGVLTAYKACVHSVALFGPTNFSPIISKAAAMASKFSKSGSCYVIFVIFTDGIITDENETKNEIVEAADLPISIIIVGIGEADFSKMVLLDEGTDGGVLRTRGGKKAARDIVQFVAFNDVKKRYSSSFEYAAIGLAKEVLHDVPRQFVKWYRQHNIPVSVNKRPVRSSEQPEKVAMKQDDSGVQIELLISAKNLLDTDIFSPMCIISMKDFGHFKFREIARTERIKNDLNPKWQQRIPLVYRFEERQEIKFDIYDVDQEIVSFNADDILGSVETTVGSIVFGAHHRVFEKRLTGLKKGSIVVACQVSPQSTSDQAFLKYIMSGGQMNCNVAIDFTGSNGDPVNANCLHYLQEENAYAETMRSILTVLEEYNEKMYPSFGFGAKLPSHDIALDEGKIELPKSRDVSVSHDFALSLDNAKLKCTGVNGVLSAYKACVHSVTLSGPTNFAPIIKRLASMVATNDSSYNILVILTDGIITDMNETMAEIVRSANLPVSILIVGVGAADFSKMIKLANCNASTGGRGKPLRDLVAFISFNNIKHRYTWSFEYAALGLARELLIEVPKQYLSWYGQQHNTEIDSIKQPEKVLEVIIELIISAKNLIERDGVPQSNPLCIISIKDFGGSQFREIARTERIKDNLNPKWQQRIPLAYHFEERQEIRFDIYDIDTASTSFGDRDFLGSLQTTVGAIVFDAYHRLFEKNLTGVKTGTIYVACEPSSKSTADITFLQYIMAGVEINSCLGIDFTGSNGEPSNPTSLHHLQGDNAYIESVRSILTVLEEYDSNKIYPSFGFGAKLPNVPGIKHDFALSLDESKLQCPGVDGVLSAYQTCVLSVMMSGPTNFAPIIRRVATMAAKYSKCGTCYTIFIILTDGIITDMGETMEEIVKAADLPVSILIVGVGGADFSKMVLLDDCNVRTSGRKAARDIVAFVSFNDVKKRYTSSFTYAALGLARELLREVPNQFITWYQQHNIPFSSIKQPVVVKAVVKAAEPKKIEAAVVQKVVQVVQEVQIDLLISAKNLTERDNISKCNPLCIILMKDFGTSEFREIARTERNKDNVNPKWQERLTLVYRFEERQEIRFDVYDIDKEATSFDKKDFFGSIETTIGSIVYGAYHRVFERSLTGVKRGTIFVACEISPKNASETDTTFLQYIMAGVEMNSSVAIDFTLSNGDPSRPNSLHSLQGDNAYIGSVRSVLAVLEEYDNDKMYPSFGFGAKLSNGKISHDFALSLDESKLECAGVDSIVTAYKTCVHSVILSGPTNFAPIIRRVATMAAKYSKCGTCYTIFIIITDGIITDMNATIEEIVNAADLPTSILIAGVGGADFSKMVLLDDCNVRTSGRKAARDIVAFVSFNDVKKRYTSSFEYSALGLARELLSEVPNQFITWYQQHNIPVSSIQPLVKPPEPEQRKIEKPVVVKEKEVEVHEIRIDLLISAENLIERDGVSHSNPLCIVSMKEFGNAQYREIARTERINNNLNPKWQQRITLLYRFEERQEIRFDVYDIDAASTSFDSKNFLGSVETTIGTIISGAYHRVFERSLTGVTRGTILVACEASPQSTADVTFLQYIMAGVEMNSSVAIDFTLSNGDPSKSNSLHYLQGDNAYIGSVRSVLAVLEEYDNDKMYPTFGFGAKLPNGKVSHDFALSLDEGKLECAGIGGIVSAYQTCVHSVNLSGPTNFAPIIRRVAATASKYSKCGTCYTVFVIITDGIITDMNATIEEIVKAADLPISIIIVGVGGADFSKMSLLDGGKDGGGIRTVGGRKASRDIVQFVAFNDVKKRYATSFAYAAIGLAKEVLLEVPKQLVTWYEQHSIPHTSLKPPQAIPKENFT